MRVEQQWNEEKQDKNVINQKKNRLQRQNMKHHDTQEVIRN
jgi:hypothetical protein